MRAHPILFSGSMVRALLDGRKTQTRRVLDTACDEPPAFVRCGVVTALDENDNPYRWPKTAATGDRLWVREAWARISIAPIVDTIDHPVVVFREGDTRCDYGGPWKPGIHLPRIASRLTLEVTGVRVQRAQDISEADAVAEGLYRQEPTAEDLEWYREHCAEHGNDPDKDPMQGVWMVPGVRQGWGNSKAERSKDTWAPTAAFGFRLLWDSLNAKRGFGWDANPWVAAYSFTVHRCNIDRMERAA